MRDWTVYKHSGSPWTKVCVDQRRKKKKKASKGSGPHFPTPASVPGWYYFFIFVQFFGWRDVLFVSLETRIMFNYVIPVTYKVKKKPPKQFYNLKRKVSSLFIKKKKKKKSLLKRMWSITLCFDHIKWSNY